MELCPGGELFEKLTNNMSPFSEHQAASIMDKLLRAIIHCHK